MVNKSLLLLFSLLILALLVAVGWVFLSKEQSIPKTKISDVDTSTQDVGSEKKWSVTPTPTSAPDWKTYSHEQLGISFSYPREYCVILSDDQAFIKTFIIDIEDPQDPEVVSSCDTGVLEKGSNPILFIYVSDRMGTQEQADPEIKKFTLPSFIIDGISTERFLEGGTGSNEGAPVYVIRFVKGDFLFILSTNVHCTAQNGSCRPPRNEQFIAEIDSIAKTIRFVR